MIYPPLHRLLEKVDCRYELVVATAKRARQLEAGSEPLITIDSTKSVTIALNEIVQGKVHVVSRRNAV